DGGDRGVRDLLVARGDGDRRRVENVAARARDAHRPQVAVVGPNDDARLGEYASDPRVRADVERLADRVDDAGVVAHARVENRLGAVVDVAGVGPRDEVAGLPRARRGAVLRQRRVRDDWAVEIEAGERQCRARGLGG